MNRHTFRRATIGIIASALMIVGVAGTALAASNPSSTGQPNQSCGSDTATIEPNGFLTSGFAHAESVYAGSDGTPSLQNANSDHAVSQYDVACYQVTSNR